MPWRSAPSRRSTPPTARRWWSALNGTKEAIDAIKAGKLLASGEFNGYLQGCIGTMAAIRHVRDLPVPKEFNFPPRVIDSTNYKELDMPESERQCPAWESVVKEK